MLAQHTLVTCRAPEGVGSLLACKSAFCGFSHLFTASSSGLEGCVRRSQDTISSSAAVSPICPSMTSTMLSASRTPAAACRSIA